MWHVLRYPAFDDMRTPTQWRAKFPACTDAEKYISARIAAGDGTCRDWGIVKSH